MRVLSKKSGSAIADLTSTPGRLILTPKSPGVWLLDPVPCDSSAMKKVLRFQTSEAFPSIRTFKSVASTPKSHHILPLEALTPATPYHLVDSSGLRSEEHT